MSASTSVENILSTDIADVAVWTGKKFGELRGFRFIERDIRILSHTGGFSIFLPSEIWRRLDHQVPIVYPVKDDESCWIAGKNFVFVKYDITPSELDDELKDYASEDTKVVLNKVEAFVRINYFSNPRAYPDSEYFTHGSFKDAPEAPRPFRFRLGGNFYYRF